jgi:transposase-like protein
MPNCARRKTAEAGRATRSARDGRDPRGRQKYACRACRRGFTEASAAALGGYRWPVGVILTAVRWYLACPLSSRQVLELLAERGIDVSHRTVLAWVQACGPRRAAAVRRRRRPVGQRRFVDEVFLFRSGRAGQPLALSNSPDSACGLALNSRVPRAQRASTAGDRGRGLAGIGAAPNGYPSLVHTDWSESRESVDPRGPSAKELRRRWMIAQPQPHHRRSRRHP